MNEKAFMFLFVAVIIGMFMVSLGEREGGRAMRATSTSSVRIPSTPSDTATLNQGGQNNISTNPSSPGGTLSNYEIKAELEDLYDEAWELEQKVDAAVRRRPASPYSEYVSFSRSSATSENPDREYLTLILKKNAPPLTITNWSIESYVTEKRVTIPEGAKRYKAGSVVNTTDPIVLYPGQRAFLITGKSPVRTSFSENMCIGFALQNKTFYPGVTNACPRPMELMERYGNIALDDDRCYAFMKTVRTCETVEDDDERIEHLSNSCQDFVREYLSYNSCVARFSDRTDFYAPNDWYIYFERTAERWRKQREIIRLLDEEERVVAVIEY